LGWNDQRPQRIAVIGISGAGKSTLARRLAEKTGLPAVYMDRVFWEGNWQPVPEAVYLAKHAALIAEAEWIIEGFVEQAMAERLRIADLVLYLDYSGLRCGWQVFRRWLTHRKISRPELPSEAVDWIDARFLWLVVTRGERRYIESALAVTKPARLERFRSPRALERFLASA
jgi:adenylate kinase family enzyme